ncbi:MAG TPA: hypothetical protein VG965_01690 [Patescibacteria group bacterium]|nr:hypothetical protein [Patescibacteria group bacterium]
MRKKSNNQVMSPLAAAATGAVIGAGAAVIGTAALKDKKNREAIKKVLTGARTSAMLYVENAQKRVGQNKQLKSTTRKTKVSARRAAQRIGAVN